MTTDSRSQHVDSHGSCEAFLGFWYHLLLGLQLALVMLLAPWRWHPNPPMGQPRHPQPPLGQSGHPRPDVGQPR